ncbi:MAG TPA: pyruvate dehydrogenase complex dihydrolipoamide acetyltransferase [Gemmatimonadaceae bacterium]|jgi:pyruvate dehydrogenase E2 component (dihydrolipoamide acetyltransferase)|nr:pyruvate dehydrogenase complex dihydrolipoamide acetyltransferase [Gemmatimonadaceae bacterium]
MATKVFMEALSPTMEEGRLVKWLKNEGDKIASGDVLAEVETDKAIMELVARGDGVLRKRLIGENATAPVGTLIGVIAAPDEKIDDLTSAAPQQKDGAQAPSAPAPAPSAQPAAAPAQPPSPKAEPQPQPQTSDLRPQTSEARPQTAATKSSPLARRLAAERGVDLTSVSGSGPGGRIVKRDVEAARVAAPAPAAQAPRAPRPRSDADYTDVPLTQIRKTIARRLVESIGPIPTFYLTAEFDMERVAEMRGAMAQLGDEYKVSFNDIVLKAVATALAQHPECNAHWLGDAMRFWNRVHLGIAVATEAGLITPVIFDADQKRLSEIAAEARDLAGRARERKLKPEEYTGSTFTVSNLGMFGIEHFTAIINPPEAAILAIGTIEARPVAHNENIVVRRRMSVTMSCDHRVIDGAAGAKFLQTLKRLVENPLMLVY